MGPSIAYEIENYATCEFEKMLEVLLGENLTIKDCIEKVLPLCKDVELKKELDAYYAVRDEAEITVHAPFVRLANRSLKLIRDIEPKNRESHDILFHVNHSKHIESVHNGCDDTRIPGVVLVTLEAALAAGHGDNIRDGWDSVAFNAAAQPPEKSFAWDKIYLPLEFRSFPKVTISPPEIYRGTAPICVRPRKVPENPYELKMEPNFAAAEAMSSMPLIKQQQPVASEPARKHTRNVSTSMNPFISGAKRRFESTAQTSNKKLKPSPSASGAPKLDVTVQTAMYAAEILSALGSFATSTMALIIIGDIIHVWWYDRQGAIQTTGLDFIRDLPYFLVLLYALEHIQPAGILDTGEDADHTTITIPQDTESSFKFKLGEELFRHDGIIGQATKVYTAICTSHEELAGVELIVKVSSVQETRTSEVTFLAQAKSIAENSEDDEVKNAIIGHIPEVITTCDYPLLDTKIIRDKLGIQGGPGCENRRLRVLVSHRKFPITAAPADQFLSVFFDCVTCE
ncbi:hypothetical protein FRB95_006981 [Tulasnella sp. JGI-2019a]|nr:hypothetical protein FRB95_006981 [Tulasnella sp. JGI-2019a]